MTFCAFSKTILTSSCLQNLSAFSWTSSTPSNGAELTFAIVSITIFNANSCDISDLAIIFSVSKFGAASYFL